MTTTPNYPASRDVAPVINANATLSSNAHADITRLGFNISLSLEDALGLSSDYTATGDWARGDRSAFGLLSDLAKNKADASEGTLTDSELSNPNLYYPNLFYSTLNQVTVSAPDTSVLTILPTADVVETAVTGQMGLTGTEGVYIDGSPVTMVLGESAWIKATHSSVPYLMKVEVDGTVRIPGKLMLSNDAATGSEAVRKSQMDAALALKANTSALDSKLSLTGGDITGVTTCVWPTVDYSIVPKEYLETRLARMASINDGRWAAGDRYAVSRISGANTHDIALKWVSGATALNVIIDVTHVGNITYTPVSSKRYKTVLSDPEPDYAKFLNEVKVVSFAYGQEAGSFWAGEKHIGFLAEDVSVAAHDSGVPVGVIETNGDGQIENIRDRDMIAALWAVVQQQQSRLDALEVPSESQSVESLWAALQDQQRQLTKMRRRTTDAEEALIKGGLVEAPQVAVPEPPPPPHPPRKRRATKADAAPTEPTGPAPKRKAQRRKESSGTPPEEVPPQ